MSGKKKPGPLQSRVKELLKYCPDTGLFTFALSRRGCKLGKIAGWIKNNGHIAIRIDGIEYIASRIAWLYMTGKWPEEVDHINCNSLDNRWSNLRECTSNENLLNRRMAKSNKSGYKWVHWHKGAGKWRGVVKLNRKSVFDGLFASPEEAHDKFAIAAREFHGQFARSM